MFISLKYLIVLLYISMIGIYSIFFSCLFFFFFFFFFFFSFFFFFFFFLQIFPCTLCNYVFTFKICYLRQYNLLIFILVVILFEDLFIIKTKNMKSNYLKKKENVETNLYHRCTQNLS